METTGDGEQVQGKAEPSLQEVCAFAKQHVELDRLQAAREEGYLCALHRVLHAGSMAKGDLLVGVPGERWPHVHHLLSPS